MLVSGLPLLRRITQLLARRTARNWPTNQLFLTFQNRSSNCLIKSFSLPRQHAALMPTPISTLPSIDRQDSLLTRNSHHSCTSNHHNPITMTLAAKAAIFTQKNCNLEAVTMIDPARLSRTWCSRTQPMEIRAKQQIWDRLWPIPPHGPSRTISHLSLLRLRLTLANKTPKINDQQGKR